MNLEALITSALRLNAVGAGVTPSADELSDGLELANFIIDGWNGEPGAQPKHDFVSLVLSGAQSYILAPRPLLITGANAANTGGVVEVVKVVTDAAEFGALARERAVINNWPKAVFCDYGYPTCTLHVAPLSTGVLYLSVVRPMFTEFAALTDVVTFGVPGYLKLMRLELAVGLSAEYGRPVLPAIVAELQAARESLGIRNTASRSGAPPAAPAA